jgi:bifunctional enzyme CysN/CysC
VPVISPYRADRETVRAKHEEIGLRFVEVFVDTPLEVCEERDPKGLYARARAGEITGMTGVDDPYEAPLSADLTVDSSLVSVAEAVRIIAARLGNDHDDRTGR